MVVSLARTSSSNCLSSSMHLENWRLPVIPMSSGRRSGIEAAPYLAQGGKTDAVRPNTQSAIVAKSAPRASGELPRLRVSGIHEPCHRDIVGQRHKRWLAGAYALDRVDHERAVVGHVGGEHLACRAGAVV